MPVIADLHWDPNPTFRITRSYMWGFAVGWHGSSSVVSYGNPTVVQENTFGGYRAHIKFSDWIYTAGNKSFTMGDALEDLYVTAPGSGVPISAGYVLVKFDLTTTVPTPYIAISLLSPTTWYLFQALPPNEPDYWSPVIIPKQVPPFIIT